MEKKALAVRIGIETVQHARGSRATMRQEHEKIRHVVACLLFVAVACVPSHADARKIVSQITELSQLPPPPNNYPVPHDPHMLFYLQRSSNSNTIVYAANIDYAGRLDPQKPIVAYWRRYTEGGQRMALRFLERILAFDTSAQPVDGQPNAYEAYIVSYPDRPFRVDVDKAGVAEAVVKMGNTRARLVSAYVELDDSTFIPTILYVDLYGIDLAKGAILRERLTPQAD